MQNTEKKTLKQENKQTRRLGNEKESLFHSQILSLEKKKEKKERNKPVNYRHTHRTKQAVEKLSSHSWPFGHDSQTINICKKNFREPGLDCDLIIHKRKGGLKNYFQNKPLNDGPQSQTDRFK